MAKKKRRWNGWRFLRNLLIIALLVFVAYSVYVNLTKPPSDILQVTFENIALNSHHQGIILRNEVVVKSINAGTFTPNAVDGERVKRNQIVGQLIVTEPPVSEEEAAISEVKLPIIDEAALQDEIDQLYAELVANLIDKSFTQAKLIKDTLNMKLSRMERLVQAKSESAYAQLTTTDSVGAAGASVGQEIEILSKEAGTLTYFFDDYEDVLTFDNRYRIDYNQLFETDIAVTNQNSTQIVPEQRLFKIVSDVVWYIACQVQVEEMEQFKRGEAIIVTLKGETVKGKVDDVFESNGMGILLLEMSQQASSMHNTRSVEIDIKREEVMGLKVPRSALVTRGETIGVYAVDINKTLRFMPVLILAEMTDQVVVQEGAFKQRLADGSIEKVYTIKHGDKIVNNAISYEEGDLIE